MDHFQRLFLWRLVIACCFLTVLVALGGHLVAIGKLSELQGHHVGYRVALIAVSSGLATAACLYPLLVNLHRRVFRFADDVVTGNLELARSMGEAIALRDSDTGGHNIRVTLYALTLAEALDDPSLDMRTLLLGAFLHDVGKIGIHDALLLKPGRLTEEEMAVMRTHVCLGLKIIENSQWLQLARNGSDFLRSTPINAENRHLFSISPKNAPHARVVSMPESQPHKRPAPSRAFVSMPSCKRQPGSRPWIPRAR
jgi:hypothetical protein